jgi:hypothetical protein
LDRQRQGLEGIRLASAWVQQPVILESDCLTLIKALQSPGQDRASWQGGITETKALSELLPDVRFHHVKRDCNLVTHALAQVAMRRRQWKVMRFDFPPDITNCTFSYRLNELASSQKNNMITILKNM